MITSYGARFTERSLELNTPTEMNSTIISAAITHRTIVTPGWSRKRQIGSGGGGVTGGSDGGVKSILLGVIMTYHRG